MASSGSGEGGRAAQPGEPPRREDGGGDFQTFERCCHRRFRLPQRASREVFYDFRCENEAPAGIRRTFPKQIAWEAKYKELFRKVCKGSYQLFHATTSARLSVSRASDCNPQIQSKANSGRRLPYEVSPAPHSPAFFSTRSPVQLFVSSAFATISDASFQSAESLAVV